VQGFFEDALEPVALDAPDHDTPIVAFLFGQAYFSARGE